MKKDNINKIYNQPNKSSKKRKPVMYVDNERMLAEIVKYRELCAEAVLANKEKPRIPEYIGECIYKIATGLSMKLRFINYSFKEEMVSDAIENCILYFDNFDPKIGQNPFAYFTQIIYFAFHRRILKEEKNRYIIYKSFQESCSMLDDELMVDYDDKLLTGPTIYDNINEFISNFEKREVEKKIKRKEAKKGLEKFQKQKPEGE